VIRITNLTLCCSAALAVLLSSNAGADARPPKTSADKVKLTVDATKPDAEGVQTVTLTLNIEKGWHLYANPVGQMDLVDAQTVVKLSGKGKPEVVKIEYPTGVEVKDKVVGDYRVYEDKVEIKAKVRRAKNDAEKLEIGVSVSACSNKTCLAADTIKTTVP
jgi:DsbC/DsbD-like thiol-disulfide interchange protein